MVKVTSAHSDDGLALVDDGAVRVEKDEDDRRLLVRPHRDGEREATPDARHRRNAGGPTAQAKPLTGPTLHASLPPCERARSM